MRKAVLATIGAVALALSGAASAAVMVTSSTNLNKPDPFAAGSVVYDNGIYTINFGQNPLTTPTFSGAFNFTNDEPGTYNFILGTSTPGATFTGASVSDGTTTYDMLFYPGDKQGHLDGVNLLANTSYTFSFTGKSTIGGTLTGNVSIAAVPEPATWAMMLLGFGAIGVSMRSRRRPALAQIA